MLLILLSVLLSNPDAERARALLALAAAQAQAARQPKPQQPPVIQPKGKMDNVVKPIKPPGLGTQATPLAWRPTTDPQQSALFRGTVQIGVWHHVLQVYWPCDPTATAWGEPTLPPIDPPAVREGTELLDAPQKRLDYVKPQRGPRSFLGPAAPKAPGRQNC